MLCFEKRQRWLKKFCWMHVNAESTGSGHTKLLTALTDFQYSALQTEVKSTSKLKQKQDAKT